MHTFERDFSLPELKSPKEEEGEEVEEAKTRVLETLELLGNFFRGQIVKGYGGRRSEERRGEDERKQEEEEKVAINH